MKPTISIRTHILISILTALIAVQSVYCQETTKRDIFKLMPSMFRKVIYKASSGATSSIKIDSVTLKNILSGLRNDNITYLDYIRANYYNNDTLFNKLSLEMISRYLSANGVTIKDYRPQPKLKVSIQELTECASRFFYPLEFTDSMRFSYKICVGLNGNSEARRNGKPPIRPEMYPLVEAFCAMTVMSNFGNSEFNLQSDIGQSIEKAAKETSDIKDFEERIEAARPRMYEAMSHSETLKKLLLSEYQKKKDMLNFEVTE